MRWNREEYIAHCKGEYVGKEMFCELFRPMIGLKEEWAAQGATESERALTAFGWDYVPHPFAAANAGPLSGIEPHVVEETADFTEAVDHYGRRTRLSKKRPRWRCLWIFRSGPWMTGCASSTGTPLTKSASIWRSCCIRKSCSRKASWCCSACPAVLMSPAS